MSQAIEATELKREAGEHPAATVERALEWTVQIVLALAILFNLVAPFLAIGFMQRPFLGAFVEVPFAFNGIGEAGDPAWGARRTVPVGYRLQTVDGIPVRTAAELGAVLAARTVGQTVALGTLAPDDTPQVYSVTLTQFPLADLIRFFIVPALVGWAYLGIGVWVFRLRRNESAGRAFALTCALAGLLLGTLFDFYTTHVFTWAWTIAVANVGAAAIVLGLVFPRLATPLSRQPLLRLVIFIPAMLLAAYALYTVYAPGVDPYAYVWGWRLEFIFVGLGMTLLLGMMLYRWLRNESPIVRSQSGIIFAGMLLGFAPVLVWVATQVTPQPWYFNSLYFIAPLILFPAAVAYTILRHRLLDTDAVLGRGLTFALVTGFTLAGYGLVLAGLSVLLGTALNASDPLTVTVLVLVLVFISNPIRERLQRWIERAFFQGSRTYTRQLEQFGRVLTQAAGLYEITTALAQTADEVVKPAHLHVFLHDSVTDEFAAAPDDSGQATTDIRFASDGPLATHLKGERNSLLLSPEQTLPQRLVRDRARLAVLGSGLYTPLRGKSGLTGWLAVGPKLSGEPFSRDDLRFIESLADQAALAVERASVINDLERRVKELNVLSQMSQAVSFTTAFNDLLELINAQAGKIVDARNFFLALKDPRGVARYELYVENDDRILEREGQPVPDDRGLESVILGSGQPIRTDDYTEECHRREVTPGAKLYRAWMGVPLNAGPETIGAMMVAATDPTITFTDDQLKIFWAIADQAASAITKARLFQQSEERARQLATLNEVSLTIASTLELDPLLEKIVQSAVSILNCEAGSLYLIDADTGEYVFRVAVGPVGQNLVGTRIAPGRGFVGEAIEGGRPVIVNDVEKDARWYKDADTFTGFHTHALITVPLKFKGRPIGALQLINKRDGSPFDENDQTLLTAFTTPSVIAIENARLFTQTDEALNARVDELSALQRIGRELNTTLETNRVMAVTLRAAMRSASALAGWGGLTSESGVNVLVSEGYGEAAAHLSERSLPLDEGLLGRVLATGEPQLLGDVVREAHGLPVLDSTRAVFTIPLRRERQVIGLIVLESNLPEGFTPEQQAFGTRLGDLAAIALTNARLYAEVHAANLAKSEFVSFVAHELKTPMTSIKGYADLLMGGVVGQPNDMQRQFLGTIRGNVERMNTLVSDLSDVARIESGRLKLELKPLPITAVTDDVIRSTSALLEAKKQLLTVEIPTDLPYVLADYVRTSQVVTNLISNAHKYTPEGGHIVLRAARAENIWEPDGPPEVLHLSVQDDGIGIAPEDQRKLFQKFFRAEDRMAREMATGTGLGLNIVKNLIEMQGGRIWFESEYRKGSTFHFTLPFAPVAEASS
jgi:signal transduction histidine kinase